MVNTNQDEYLKAKRRLEQAERQKKLEKRVESLEYKLDQILDLLQRRL